MKTQKKTNSTDLHLEPCNLEVIQDHRSGEIIETDRYVRIKISITFYLFYLLL